MIKRCLDKEILIIPFFLSLVVILFRQAIFRHLVPLPVNFMAFWYEPFKSQTWPGYPLGIPHKAIGADIFRNLYPLKKLAIELLVSRQWPLWNPYIFSGTPLLANFQTSIFNPFNFFYFFLPFLDAWTMMVFLQPFLAGLFMYLFLRAIKISRLGAWFSASAFALLPFLIVWLEYGVFGHTLIWLPLILFAIEKFLKKISWWSLLLITLAFALAIFGGHPQPLFFVFLIAISYFLFNLVGASIKLKREKFFLFFLAVFFSFLLTAVQLLPTFELYELAAISSTSSQFIFDKFLLPFSHLITFFVPDFFGNIATYNFWGYFDYTETIGYFGILSLLFGLYAIFWRKEKRVLFFAILAVISLSLAFPLPTTKFLISLNLPVISTNVPSRIFFITGFSFVVLAGFGIDEWRRKLNPRISLKRSLKVVIPIGFIYLGLIIFIFLAFRFLSCPPFQKECWLIALRNIILPGSTFFIGSVLIILGSLRERWKNHAVLALILLSLLGGFYFSDKFLPFSDRQFVYPLVPVLKFLEENAGIDRFFGFSQAEIIPNLTISYRLFSPNGYDPLYIKRYGQLLEAAGTDGQIKEVVARSDAYLPPGSETDLLKDNPRRKRLLDLLGVKYILAKSESSKFPQADYQLVWGEGDWRIYQNKETFPRIFLVSQAVVEKDSQTIADKIFAPTFDLKKTVILEEELPNDFSLDNSNLGKAILISYQPNRIEVETETPNNRILFISDVFHPGWNAYLDSKKEKVYRANFIFRSVVIPKGKHRVIFSYEPQSFYLGLKITLGGGILFIIWLLFISKWDLEKMRKERS